MDKRNKILISLGISFFIVFSMFLFGDLGIVQTHRKEIKLYKLQKEIAVMKQINSNKKKLIEQLRNDPATIKEQATLYGLVGGITVNKKNKIKPIIIPTKITEQGLQSNASSNVLLEHPALLILLVIIVLLITVFILNIKSKQLIKQPQKKAYIKPSWN